jgi:dTDP-4-dehydrorhamnose reductase
LEKGAGGLGCVPATYAGARVHYATRAELDITDAGACDNYIDSNAIDLVVNCASYTNVDGCETNTALAHAVNVDGPANLARAVNRNGGCILQLSSDYVFAGDDPRPRREDDPTGPQSVYGTTKLISEQKVAELCPRHFVVRTAWLYGAQGPNFVLTMLRLAARDGEIKVVDDQHGSPTYAADLAWALLHLAQGTAYGIYHCTNSGSCSWFDFASSIVQAAGIDCIKTPCTTEQIHRPAHRPAWSILDNNKFAASTGIRLRPWPEALQSYLGKVL